MVTLYLLVFEDIQQPLCLILNLAIHIRAGKLLIYLSFSSHMPIKNRYIGVVLLVVEAQKWKKQKYFYRTTQGCSLV